MVLRKTPIDNSVRFVTLTEKTQENKIKPKKNKSPFTSP